MAERFVADTQAADQIAEQLTGVRSSLESATHPLQGLGTTEADAIDAALDDFRDAASDTQVRLGRSIGSAAGRFTQLSSDVVALDEDEAGRA